MTGDKILLAHGGGGRLMQELIASVFQRELANPLLSAGHDSAVLEPPRGRLAFTTDSYVVKPLFFPGGDIGKLAVYGTINDLAMSGARPLYLSLGVILEEGFPMDSLQRITRSISEAARECGVQVVTGDTKVVERGKGDGIYINTAGIGVIESDLAINPKSVRAGDAVLVSGDLGRHGVAILSAREGLNFETTIESDCAPLATMVLALIQSGVPVHCLRDLTRGGLNSALNEIATASGLGVSLEEDAIPVSPQVKAACEILGLDPLSVANEGRLVVILPESGAPQALEIMKRHSVGRDASLIGRVSTQSPGMVTLRNNLGVSRILDLFGGELLPRIC